jgi:hypothetical protein
VASRQQALNQSRAKRIDRRAIAKGRRMARRERMEDVLKREARRSSRYTDRG